MSPWSRLPPAYPRPSDGLLHSYGAALRRRGGLAQRAGVVPRPDGRAVLYSWDRPPIQLIPQQGQNLSEAGERRAFCSFHTADYHFWIVRYKIKMLCPIAA